MKSYEIRGCGKDSRGDVTGSMVWNWREGKWVDFDGDDGTGTSMTADTVSVKTINDAELRAFAEGELARAKDDCGFLVDIELREDDF